MEVIEDGPVEIEVWIGFNGLPIELFMSMVGSPFSSAETSILDEYIGPGDWQLIEFISRNNVIMAKVNLSC